MDLNKPQPNELSRDITFNLKNYFKSTKSYNYLF
jgi:hypothetical protein